MLISKRSCGHNSIISILSIMVCLLLGEIALADTRYVSDRLVITVREGKGTGFKVVTVLESNTPVEILAEEENYLKVKTQKGEEGWVQKRYITADTPKSIIIAKMKSDLAKLRKQMDQLKTSRKNLNAKMSESQNSYSQQLRLNQQELATKQKEVADLAKQLQVVQKQYETLKQNSENVTGLMEANKQLLADNQNVVAAEKKIRSELDLIQKENTRLMNSRLVRWFLAGSGVLLVGLITGRLTRRRRYY